MKEIYTTEDIEKAQMAIKAFEIDYCATSPKAVAKSVDRDDACSSSTLPGRALDPSAHQETHR